MAKKRTKRFNLEKADLKISILQNILCVISIIIVSIYLIYARQFSGRIYTGHGKLIFIEAATFIIFSLMLLIYSIITKIKPSSKKTPITVFDIRLNLFICGFMLLFIARFFMLIIDLITIASKFR